VDAGRRWAQAAHAYVRLLREHIYKENNVLFPLADSLLSGAEQSQLRAGFEELESTQIGAGTEERLRVLMERLAA